MEITSQSLKISPNNLWISDDMIKIDVHKPVMCNEILEYLGSNAYFETNAKLGTGVEDLFITLIKKMYNSGK